MSSHHCPICGSTKFKRFGRRPLGACSGCNAKERTRTVFAMMEALRVFDSAESMLHIAPELALVPRLQERFGSGYVVADINPQALSRIDDSIEKVVLDMSDVPESILSRSFDVILHSHVLEHIRASWQLSFLRLHALIPRGGYHFFAIPIKRDWSKEDLADMSSGERTRRYGQHDHMRYIGRMDFQKDIATICALTDSHMTTAKEVLGETQLSLMVGDEDVYALAKT